MITDALTDTFNELRPLLFSIAYRMTSSRTDAEDILQEAFIRWRSVSEPVESAKAFLTTVVSRISLDVLKAAHRKREVYAGPWLPEPLVGPVSEPVELAESLSFAFLHLLETLRAEERVAFLLREVFDAPYIEIASVLETNEPQVRQLVSRAREHLHSKRPKRKVQPETHELLLKQFMQACANGDGKALAHLLKDDAILYSDGGGRVSAALNPIYGANRIIRFILGIGRKGLGQFGGYGIEVNGGQGAVVTLNGGTIAVVTIDPVDDAIQTVFFVMNPDKLPPLDRR